MILVLSSRAQRGICTCSFLAALGMTAGAQQTDVIRGRVTGPDSLPIQGVNVRATSYAGSIVKSASTDKNGRFTIIFINGEGDYWLDFAKLGYAPRRFEVKKFGDEEVLLANTRLSSTIVSLDRVNVTAPGVRALPNRNARDPDVSGGDRALVNAGLAAADPGNLAAMAAGIPGFQLIPGLDGAADMFSFLGIPGDQNSITFNGLGSGINAVPPDILASTSIRPYPFDPSFGGFGGAQVSIQTIPGSNFSRRAITSANISPPLEWADATATAQGQEYTSLRFGGNAAGPIAMNTSFYNIAWNAARRFSDWQSVLDADPVGLAAAGVSADSAKRLGDILLAQSVPTHQSTNPPAHQYNDAAQLALNVDWSPSQSGTGHGFTFGLLGDLQRLQPTAGNAALLLATPSHNNETTRWGANAAVVHTNYFWFGVLSKTTIGFAGSSVDASPFLEMPQGTVLVGSLLNDGSSSVRRLAFGGAPQASAFASQAVQINNSMSWYSGNNSHALKLTTGLTRDGYSSDSRANQLGTFSFNSLADLEAHAPSSFTRTMSSRTERGAQLTAVASLGDYWRPIDAFQMQYGVRVETNRFLDRPQLNQALLDATGMRNDVIPNRVYASPRAGLQWFYGKGSQVEYAPGSARAPRGVIHAGVGVFQNMASSQLVSSAMSATGLPESMQSITCVGNAVPFPDWTAFQANASNIPTSCVGGTSTPFAQLAPSAALFASDYRQPRSLRAAVDWASAVLDNRFVIGLQGIISRGVDQPGWIDANFDATVRFTTEGGRTVYADPTTIVPSTGAISPKASRVIGAFQKITEQRSDLDLDSRQFSVNLLPITTNPYLKWELTYNHLNVRESYYGFTSTVGNPEGISRGERQQGGRHMVQVGWSDFPLFDFIYLSAMARVSSGMQYAPMVASDVNGDGFANDRAFVFTPGDSVLGGAMRSLLDAASPAVRKCLETQLNTLAARGSCQAPWTSTATLQAKFNPAKLGLPKRATLGLTIQNPLGVADLVLHGDDDLRGWGQAIPPDPNLLFVRGFGPATNRFRYDVNERFGSTRPRQSATRSLPYLSIGLFIDIGVPRERQVLSQRLDIGRRSQGTKQPAPSLKQMGMSAIPNPMLLILQQQDSLHLTQRQADSLAGLSRKYSVFADSIWTPISSRLAQLPDRYDSGEAWTLFVSAREKTVDYLLTLVPHAKGILTSSQRRKLPPQLAIYLDERVLRFLRSSSAGDASSLLSRGR